MFLQLASLFNLRVLFRFLFLGALIALSAVTLQAQTKTDDDVITLSANLVTLNVTVTNGRGDFVRNLTKGHFNIVEDGKPQKIALFSAEETPYAAAIALDVSGSMRDKLSLARTATANFADRLRPDDVLAIYQFATDFKQLQDFTSVRDVADDLWENEADGFTRMYDCVYEALEALGKREEKRRAILVISDGMDNRSGRSLDAILKKALQENVIIFTVDLIGAGGGGGVAQKSEESMGHQILKDLAQKTGGRYLLTPGGQQLYSALEKVAEELSNQYTIGYYSNNEKRDGKWRKVEVQLPRPDINLHTRLGYYAPKDSN